MKILIQLLLDEGETQGSIAVKQANVDAVTLTESIALCVIEAGDSVTVSTVPPASADIQLPNA